MFWVMYHKTRYMKEVSQLLLIFLRKKDICFFLNRFDGLCGKNPELLFCYL